MRAEAGAGRLVERERESAAVAAAIDRAARGDGALVLLEGAVPRS